MIPQNVVEFDIAPRMVNKAMQVESDCLSIVFINLGASVATVANCPLTQGQQISMSVEVGGIIRTVFGVSFDNVSADTQLLVITTTYR